MTDGADYRRLHFGQRPRRLDDDGGRRGPLEIGVLIPAVGQCLDGTLRFAGEQDVSKCIDNVGDVRSGSTWTSVHGGRWNGVVAVQSSASRPSVRAPDELYIRPRMGLDHG